jgi:hypothetical protein
LALHAVAFDETKGWRDLYQLIVVNAGEINVPSGQQRERDNSTQNRQFPTQDTRILLAILPRRSTSQYVSCAPQGLKLLRKFHAEFPL